MQINRLTLTRTGAMAFLIRLLSRKDRVAKHQPIAPEADSASLDPESSVATLSQSAPARPNGTLQFFMKAATVPLELVRLLGSALYRLNAAAWKECIKRHALGRTAETYLALLRLVLWRVPALQRHLRQISPDVVVSFLGATNILTIASARKLPVRLVISERNDPGRQTLDEPWQTLRPIVYPLADVVTANSHGALERMRDYCPREKLAYLPNPVVAAEGVGSPRANAILFLARLVPQKAPEVLVDAFATFARENPEWTLHFAGDGPMQTELIERACRHGIADKVTFHGLVSDPTTLLRSCRIFVLPSRFEGTPNSLLEAMAAGLACVVTDASPGPLTLIEHGVSGLVVRTDDVADLSAALRHLAQDQDLCFKLAATAIERTRPYHLENVAQEWSRLLFAPYAAGPAMHPSR
jgi:glycosyltransferase involved in cell wall biosynthesis